MEIKTLLLICVFFSSFFTLGSAQEVKLTVDKKTILKERQKSIEADAKATRYQWLSPVNLSASHTQQYSDRTDTKSGISQLGVSFSQNLFRSGGIYYTIKYADDKYGYDRLSLEQQSSVYQKAIILSTLRLKKYQLQLQQSKYLIENKKITLFLKEKQYEVGDIDITLLNDALMDKNSEQTKYAALQESFEKEKLELQKYTETSWKSIDVPKFSLFDEDKYKKNNYNIALAREQNSLTYDTYRRTIADYLPSLRFNAQATYSSYDSGAVILNQNGTMYSAGLTLNIPLDYNIFASKEKVYADYLIQKAQTNDTQREELLEYKKTLLSIKRYQELNKILKENLELYNKVRKVTKKAFDTGYKTGYDLKILDNSISSARLEIEINKTNIELELAKLHFAIRDTKEQ
ncbi:MAG: TolC family protein [Sulfurimonas sp.]